MPGICIGNNDHDAIKIIVPSESLLVHETEVNGSLIPVKITGVPSAVDEIVVPDEDVNPIVGSQECSTETIVVEDVDKDEDEDLEGPPMLHSQYGVDYDSSEMIWMGSIIDENSVRKSTCARCKPVMNNVDFNNKRYNDGDVVDGTIHMNIPEEEPGMTEGDSLLHVLGVAMLQSFSIKSGLNRYGEAGKKAVNK